MLKFRPTPGRDASWDHNGIGKLDEVFHFNDGIEYRVWQLVPKFDEQQQVIGYQASATDVPRATTLNFAGNAIYMEYDLNDQTGTDA